MKKTSLDPLAIFYQFPYLTPSGSYYKVLWGSEQKLKRELDKMRSQNADLTTSIIIGDLITRLSTIENNQQLSEKERIDISPHGLAKEHLRAWLSRFSVKAAIKIRCELSKSYNAPADTYDFFQDLLQIALEPTLNTEDFFSKFQERNGKNKIDWQPNTEGLTYLKGWSYRRIYGRTVDSIREKVGQPFKRTNLGLAKRSTKSAVIKALIYSGSIKVNQESINNLVIDPQLLVAAKEKDIKNALSCFGNLTMIKQSFWVWQQIKELNKTNKIEGKTLTSQQIQELTKSYRQEFRIEADLKKIESYLKHLNYTFAQFCKIIEVWKVFKEEADLKKDVDGQLEALADRYQQLTTTQIPIKPSEIKEINEQIGLAIRRYIGRTMNTLELDRPIGKDRNLTLIDTVTDDNTFSLEQLEKFLEENEYQEKSSSLKDNLTEIINTLDPEQQHILVALYSDKLTEQEIGMKLNVSQATISRRKRRILNIFIEQLNVNQNDQLNLNRLAERRRNLISCLKEYYKE